MYKHYIKIDEYNNIINTYSKIYNEPDQSFIFFKESDERHFNLQIFFEKNGFLIYYYIYNSIDNTYRKKNQTEIDNEIEIKKNNINNKLKKISEIKVKLLEKNSWINSMYISQKYGHDKGINKKPKLLTDLQMDEWSLWFEELSYIEDDHDISLINYDDIHIGNTSLFPISPNNPGDIIKKNITKRYTSGKSKKTSN